MYYKTSYESNPYAEKARTERRARCPENHMYGQCYVPIQYLNKVYEPATALKKGTLFPELSTTYVPGQSMREIAYIRNANKKEEMCKW